MQKIKEKYEIRNTFYVKLYLKLTLTCARYLVVPLPIGSSTNPVRTWNVPRFDDRITLWHIAEAKRAGPSGAPNPVGIVAWVPAEVVIALIGMSTAQALSPLHTGDPVNCLTSPTSIVSAFAPQATNDVINLPFLPERQAPACVEMLQRFFHWAALYPLLFSLLACRTTATIRAAVARSIFVVVVASEPFHFFPRWWCRLICILPIIPLILCEKSK